MSPDLPRNLLERLGKAAIDARGAERAIAALAQLEPAAAATWLVDQEQTARAICTHSELARLLSLVVSEGLANENQKFAPRAAELVQRYAGLVGADTLASVVSALPVEQRGERLRELVLEVLKREPAHAGVLRAAVGMAASAGDGREVHRLLTRLGRADDSQANVHCVWRKRRGLPSSGGAPVRAALMSSFTVDPLAHYLDLECRALGLDPHLYVAPFNSWAQEVFDEESGLRRFDPEIAFLAVSIDDLIPELAGAATPAGVHAAGETAVDRVLAPAQQFATWSNAVLVVHSFQSVYPDPEGSLAGRLGPSRAAWLADLNAQLAEGLQALPRAYMLDMNDLLLRRPGGALDNPKMRHLASLRLCRPVLGEVARAYVRWIAPLKGLTCKCVVVDLDNTLWGGIVGEDGPQDIKLGNTSPGSEYQEFQRYLLSLTQHGFLLAINSKNNAEEALGVIRSHDGMVLREDAFSAMRINWRPKPENMLSLAEELSIGVDSMIFIDDSPNERELMRQVLPQVLTPDLPGDPSLYRASLEALPQLQKLVVTDEDRTRTRQYRAKREREEARLKVGSLDQYLVSLKIAVTIASGDDANLARVHQLFERTNQFNLTTRRYHTGELAKLAGDPDWRLYTLKAKDCFGDHGIVATALVRVAADCWILDSFLMSCRVIGYGVETALLAALGDHAQAAGASDLVGEYVETPKNAPARDFYPRHGFSEMGSTNGVTRWRRALTDGRVQWPTWIQLEAAGGP